MVALACNPSDKQYLVSFYRGCGNDSSAVSLRERNPCWYSCRIPPVTWVHSCCSCSPEAKGKPVRWIASWMSRLPAQILANSVLETISMAWHPWHDLQKSRCFCLNPDGALGVVVLWPVVVAPWQDSAAWHQTMNDSSGHPDIDFKPQLVQQNLCAVKQISCWVSQHRKSKVDQF